MAYLLLENGKYFEGERFGAEGDAVGELVFTTGVVGYPETLTDPRYAGQIVLQTFPLIGNYGIIDGDLTREPALAGYVVREVCMTPSNFRCDRDLDSYLKEKGIPCICGVDTRELTRILREEGTMNAVICDAIPENTAFLKKHKITDTVKTASDENTKSFAPAGDKLRRVVIVDFGVTDGEIAAFTSRGCEVVRVPYDTTAEEIMNLMPDGVVFSAGPGDPTELTAAAEVAGTLMGRVPLFGTGLGHQVIALGAGGKIYKLHCGHRGSNQPVSETHGRRTYITNQNHGYAVDFDTMNETAEVTLVNANDGTCEGLSYPGKKCFTLQFIPDSTPSTPGSAHFYDRFIEMMDGNR